MDTFTSVLAMLTLSQRSLTLTIKPAPATATSKKGHCHNIFYLNNILDDSVQRKGRQSLPLARGGSYSVGVGPPSIFVVPTLHKEKLWTRLTSTYRTCFSSKAAGAGGRRSQLQRVESFYLPRGCVSL
jgi:hypothetical protein